MRQYDRRLARGKRIHRRNQDNELRDLDALHTRMITERLELTLFDRLLVAVLFGSDPPGGSR